MTRKYYQISTASSLDARQAERILPAPWLGDSRVPLHVALWAAY
jgi:hypothetical protein